MHEWKVGDRCQITNLVSAYYLQVGLVVEISPNGGLYVLHEDGIRVYHPWGFDIVRGERDEIQS